MILRLIRWHATFYSHWSLVSVPDNFRHIQRTTLLNYLPNRWYGDEQKILFNNNIQSVFLYDQMDETKWEKQAGESKCCLAIWYQPVFVYTKQQSKSVFWHVVHHIQHSKQQQISPIDNNMLQPNRSSIFSYDNLETFQNFLMHNATKTLIVLDWESIKGKTSYSCRIHISS